MCVNDCKYDADADAKADDVDVSDEGGDVITVLQFVAAKEFQSL